MNFFKRFPKALTVSLFVAVSLIIICAFVALFIWRWYQAGQQPLVRESDQVVLFRVDRGQSRDQIADNLDQAGLLKNRTVFSWYVRLGDHYQYFQAGNFRLSPGQTVAEIVETLKRGQATNWQVTILPGQRLDQIKQSLIDQNFSRQIVEQALLPDHYLDHPVAAYWPADQPGLEGYLTPETFYVTGFELDDLMSVIRRSLNKFNQMLNDNPQLAVGFNDQGLTVHQAVIMASIVTKEVSDPEFQPTVAQVFLTRYQRGAALGSDVVLFYAVRAFGQPLDFDSDSPYNSRRHSGLPPTPIANVQLPALAAVANPSQTDYYFFLAGDDGQIHFNKTYQGHLRDRDRYCHELCKLPIE